MLRVNGLRKAVRAIKMQSAETKKKFRDAFNSSAINIEREAKQSAPVDTGRLRSDIQKQIEVTDGGLVVNAEVINTVNYAPNVEFGIGQRAQPYLFPAFERERPNLIKNIEAIL
jgi:HK97 gp10 family phage protein